MQPQKGKDFVKNLRELNDALAGLIKNIKKDITLLEKSIASNRQYLNKPYLDKQLRGNDLIQGLREHLN
ncbi:hypothetical protein [Cesiribacter andamanensis]|uniref:Uncharacterized protein n=1 Tax=Cesiribacter andamanensis AMV16 TaxID=1279009 RepID=M7N3S2_9BACT|nr:hypothetical protein [Cesiribacter andamanensis]EMR01942.1 hypothetical protein ADICEAN_02921 [Cesiribacter andamanensis AMV16]